MITKKVIIAIIDLRRIIAMEKKESKMKGSLFLNSKGWGYIIKDLPRN